MLLTNGRGRADLVILAIFSLETKVVGNGEPSNQPINERICFCFLFPEHPQRAKKKRCRHICTGHIIYVYAHTFHIYRDTHVYDIDN